MYIEFVIFFILFLYFYSISIFIFLVSISNIYYCLLLINKCVLFYSCYTCKYIQVNLLIRQNETCLMWSSNRNFAPCASKVVMQIKKVYKKNPHLLFFVLCHWLAQKNVDISSLKLMLSVKPAISSEPLSNVNLTFCSSLSLF